MRKGWKIFWIICAVIAAVGILFFVAGTALGGFAILRNNGDEEILRSWLDRLGIGVNRSISVTQEVEDVDGIEITSYTGITEMNLELTGMAVTVLPWDGEEITVDISNVRSDLKDRIRVTQDGEELDLEMQEQGRWNTNNVGTIYISVPRGMTFDSVSADAGAGVIEMEGIAAKELSVNAGVGTVEMRSFSVESLDAECGIGQIVLDGKVTSEADISCRMGEVVLTLPGARDAYNYEVSSSMGSVTLDSKDYSGIGSTVREDNGSGCWINTECSMGSVTIQFK